MIKTVIFILIGLVFIFVLRAERPEYAILTRLAVISLVSVSLASGAQEAFEELLAFSELSSYDAAYIKIGVKALGIALVTETACGVCRDCGESALAVQAQLVGRLATVGIALPVIEKLLEMSFSFID